MWYAIRNDELYHHGILGQKWGVRRFQNKDGTLTSAGKKRYMEANSTDSAVTKRVKADWNKLSDAQFRKKYGASKDLYEKRVRRYGDPYMNSPLAKIGKKLSGINKIEKESGKKLETVSEVKRAERKASNRIKQKQLKIAAIAGVTAMGAYSVAALMGLYSAHGPEIKSAVSSFVNGCKNRKVNSFEDMASFTEKYGNPVWTDYGVTDLVSVR